MAMVIKGARIYAQRVHYSQRIELALIVQAPDGRVAYAEPLVIKDQPADLAVEPFAALSVEQAQELMDELWSCGLRPTEGSGSAGSLAATQKHLEDMRAIAFGSLNLQGRAP